MRTEPEAEPGPLSTPPSSDQSLEDASDPEQPQPSRFPDVVAVAEVPSNAPNPSPGVPFRCPSELFGAPAYRDAANGGPAGATADARVAALSRLQAILFTSFSVRATLLY